MSEIAGMLVSALGQGFIYAPMALGVFLTFSILKTPDLTVEGSFVFGMTSYCRYTCRCGGRALHRTFTDKVKNRTDLIRYPYNDRIVYSKLCHFRRTV